MLIRSTASIGGAFVGTGVPVGDGGAPVAVGEPVGAGDDVTAGAEAAVALAVERGPGWTDGDADAEVVVAAESAGAVFAGGASLRSSTLTGPRRSNAPNSPSAATTSASAASATASAASAPLAPRRSA